jgi:Tfp pilus assembly protein PilO
VKKHLSIPLVVSIVVVAVVIAGYFVLLRPQSTKADNLDKEIAALETELKAANELAAPDEEPKLPIEVADLVELAKAMPDNPELADAILELNAASEGAGVGFIAISPGSPFAGAGYTQLPLTLSFEGNYYSLTELIYQLRNLVTVRDGVLDAHGRLFTIDSLDWHEAEDGFPTIQADLAVSAYVYGTNSVPTVVPGTTPTPPAEGQTTTTTAETTTGATTTGPEPTTTAPAETTPTGASQALGVTP